ncbi:MAG: zinc-ribbon domain-containing protein [Pseudomonadota bacterium]
MIVTCPACETSYFVEDSTLGQEGAQLTCISCGHAWFEQVEGIAATDEALTRGAHERYLEAVRLRGQRRSRFVAASIWMVMAVVFAGGIVASVVWRADVVRAWPESASAYEWVGLDVNRFGVDFENIERSRKLRGTLPILSVSADVRNVTDETQIAPRVRIGLLDEFDREIAHMFAQVDPTTLAPGQVGRFSAVLENPPADSYSLDLRFVPVSEAPARADQSAQMIGVQP